MDHNEKGTGGSREICMQGFLCSLLFMRGHKGHSLPLTAQMHVCNVSAQGIPLETQSPRFLLGASGHVGTLT